MCYGKVQALHTHNATSLLHLYLPLQIFRISFQSVDVILKWAAISYSEPVVVWPYLEFVLGVLQVSLLLVSLVPTAGGVASILQSSSLCFQLLTILTRKTWCEVTRLNTQTHQQQLPEFFRRLLNSLVEMLTSCSSVRSMLWLSGMNWLRFLCWYGAGSVAMVTQWCLHWVFLCYQLQSHSCKLLQISDLQTAAESQMQPTGAVAFSILDNHGRQY